MPSVSTSVPFIGAPTAWSGPQPLGVTGQNIVLASSIPASVHWHATFGGTGLLADYQANDRTVAPDAYFPHRPRRRRQGLCWRCLYRQQCARHRTMIRWTATVTAPT